MEIHYSGKFAYRYMVQEADQIVEYEDCILLGEASGLPELTAVSTILYDHRTHGMSIIVDRVSPKSSGSTTPN